jgi:hypothetical protein
MIPSIYFKRNLEFDVFKHLDRRQLRGVITIYARYSDEAEKGYAEAQSECPAKKTVQKPQNIYGKFGEIGCNYTANYK